MSFIHDYKFRLLMQELQEIRKRSGLISNQITEPPSLSQSNNLITLPREIYLEMSAQMHIMTALLKVILDVEELSLEKMCEYCINQLQKNKKGKNNE